MMEVKKTLRRESGQPPQSTPTVVTEGKTDLCDDDLSKEIRQKADFSRLRTTWKVRKMTRQI